MKIVFMGTPDFAVPALRALIAAGHQVTLVVTQSDKPQGRHQTLTPPPVKVCAVENGIPVFQPQSLKTAENIAHITAENPDVIVVVAYGKILPKELLDYPPYGAVNVHASLLPKYRGAAPIQWCILNGDTVTGVTTMQMDEGLDTGDMLLTSTREIPDDMTAGELFDALCDDGAKLLCQTLDGLQAGTLKPTPQDNDQATYVSVLSKAQSPLDFSKPAATLHNQVRGLHPWPVATCQIGDVTVKIHKTAVGGETTAAFGTVIATSPLTVACGDGRSLIIEELQYPAAKRMSAAAFLCGHDLPIGTVLK